MQLKSIGGSNISSRRNRNRQYAVLAVDMAVTFRQCRNHHILHTQIVDTDCRTDNVHYRINGPHFVEMNLFNRKPMGLGFRLCHNAEHGPGHFLHPLIGIQTVYDMINVVEVPVNVGMRMTVTSLMPVTILMTVTIFMTVAFLMTMLMLLQMHIKIKCIQTAHNLPSKMQMVSIHSQALQRILQHLPVRSQIKQGSYRHIPADARITFQI